MSECAANPEVTKLYEELFEVKKRLLAARLAHPREEIKDYVLKDSDGNPVKLSELFGTKKDLIVIHNMGKSCSYCTLWADGFIGLYPHLNNRAAFVLSSPNSPETIREFANSRGWPFPLISVEGSSFAADLGFMPEGNYYPGMSTFHLEDDGSIVRVAHAEFGEGDDFCAVWPMFDLLSGGLKGWAPKYSY